MHMERILVHNNVEQPIQSVAEAFFTSEVHRGMSNLYLKELYALQRYSWLVSFILFSFTAFH